MALELVELQRREATIVGHIAETSEMIDTLRDTIDNLKSTLSALQVERDHLQNQIQNFTPIKDSVAWIASFSRDGSHLTVVIDGNGFCTCEDARWRPESGGCKHFNEALTRGLHDHRATWRGGFDGPVDIHGFADQTTRRLVFDALVGI